MSFLRFYKPSKLLPMVAPGGSDCRFHDKNWRQPMPVLLWLLGVPLVVIIALYVFHIL